MLFDEIKIADFGNELNGGFGFRSFEEVFNTIDEECPNYGCTYKIGGDVYRLEEIGGKPEFVEIEEN